MKMKGVVFRGNRRCELRELPVPEPADDEVRIRIRATGICGSFTLPGTLPTG